MRVYFRCDGCDKFIPLYGTAAYAWGGKTLCGMCWPPPQRSGSEDRPAAHALHNELDDDDGALP